VLFVIFLSIFKKTAYEKNHFILSIFIYKFFAASLLLILVATSGCKKSDIAAPTPGRTITF